MLRYLSISARRRSFCVLQKFIQAKRVTFSDLAQLQLKLRFFVSSSILELNCGIMARTGRTAATFQLLSDYELDELMGGIDSPRDR